MKESFQEQAERMFLEANPGAEIVHWVRDPGWVDWPTGHRSEYGQFLARGKGYREAVVTADRDKDGMLVG
jgi:hypothetical protein